MTQVTMTEDGLQILQQVSDQQCRGFIRGCAEQAERYPERRAQFEEQSKQAPVTIPLPYLPGAECVAENCPTMGEYAVHLHQLSNDDLWVAYEDAQTPDDYDGGFTTAGDATLDVVKAVLETRLRQIGFLTDQEI